MSENRYGTKITNESGRSMVEMLGVLSVMGVLSIGGVYGYRVALTKYKSNELLNQISMRAISCASQIEMGNIPPSVADFGPYEDYNFTARMNADNTNQFQIQITPAPEEAICKNMKNAGGPSSIIRNFIANCDGNDANVVLTYNNDMSTTQYASDFKDSATCGQAGYEWCELHHKCQAVGTSCECPAGTYLRGTSCKVCAMGSYSSAGASSCTPCPSGSISSRGATSVDDCRGANSHAECKSFADDNCDHTNDINYNPSTGYCVMTSCYCYTHDTPITLADGTCKRADEITYDDELLVWNFDEGKMDSARPLWLQKPLVSPNYNYLKFSDGSVLKTINQHRIFNREAGKFTYLMTDDTPIGTTTLNAKGKWVKLVEKKVVEEEVTYYNIITYYHINCFAGNVLTSCRLNNLYPIKDLKFVKDNRVLAGYEGFSNLPRKWYDGVRLAEQSKQINHKGDVVFDKTLSDYVQRLIKIAQ